MKQVSSLSRIGEQKLIRRIARWCRRPARSPYWNAEVPLGDDAFVAKMTSNPSLAITTDTMMEGTHFRLDWRSQYLNSLNLWQALGHKAMASNLSDLAAMGHVVPLFAFVTLGLHGDISVNSVDNLYRGFHHFTRLYRFSIVGGDIIHSDKSMISITIVGRKLSPNVIRRSGARSGDILMASGPLGLSAAGLQVLEKNPKLPPAAARLLVRSHLLPSPKLEEGRRLSDRATMATAMMDTSDDLYTSLETLSAASRVGFEIELDRIALPSALVAAGRAFKTSPWSYFLYGGEDYQLLFTVDPKNTVKTLKRLPASYILGRVADRSRGIRILKDGQKWSGRDLRYKHL